MQRRVWCGAQPLYGRRGRAARGGDRSLYLGNQREWGREEKTTHRSHHLVRQEPDSIRAEGDDQRTLILNLNFVFLGPLEPRTAGASPRGGAGCPLTSDGGNLQRCKT